MLHPMWRVSVVVAATAANEKSGTPECQPNWQAHNQTSHLPLPPLAFSDKITKFHRDGFLSISNCIFPSELHAFLRSILFYFPDQKHSTPSSRLLRPGDSRLSSHIRPLCFHYFRPLFIDEHHYDDSSHCRHLSCSLSRQHVFLSVSPSRHEQRRCASADPLSPD